MNSEILQKAIDALKETKPDISYIRGLLETLLAVQPKPAQINNTPALHFVPGVGVRPVEAQPALKGPININNIAVPPPPVVELPNGNAEIKQ